MDSLTIITGQRTRHDMGNLEILARSIDEVGLLHPIVVTPGGQLIAGARRMAAWPLTRFRDEEIPYRVVDLHDIVRGEYAENAVRKNFTMSEIAAIARALRPIEEAAAKDRQVAGVKIPSGNFPEGQTRDKVAAFAGISGRSLEKIEAVAEAAQQEPEKYGALAEEMDRTGKVNGAYKKLKITRQAEAPLQEPAPLPMDGPYHVIVADPPWSYGRAADPSHRAANPYPPMTVQEICEMEIADLAHDDCVLWLWTTNAFMRESFAVADAWGFQVKTILTWVKPKMGTGDWLRGQTEHCLMAARGKPVISLSNQTTALLAPAREHSRKPEEFYTMVESLCPAPRYAEIFSRQKRDGWDSHGDEAK